MKNNKEHSDYYFAQWMAGEISNDALKKQIGEKEFQVYQKLKRGIEVSEALNTPVEDSFQEIQKKINSNSTKVIPLYVKWAVSIAASVLLIFGVLNFLNQKTIVQTGYGESRTIALADGTEVILNAKSTLTYDDNNWEKNRTISLKGEAYFKVKKGKPFTVKTSEGQVEVLGTEFNVNQTSDYFDVVCYEGKVKVNISSTSYILNPYDNVRKSAGQAVQRFKVKNTEPGWVLGESTFKKAPLTYVIIALQNQYNVEFNMMDINSEALYTGGFPHNDLNVALKTVFETMDINYSKIGKNTIKLEMN